MARSDAWTDADHSRILDDVHNSLAGVQIGPEGVAVNLAGLSPGALDHLSTLHFLLSSPVAAFLAAVEPLLAAMPRREEPPEPAGRPGGPRTWADEARKRALERVLAAMDIPDGGQRPLVPPSVPVARFLIAQIATQAQAVLAAGAQYPDEWEMARDSYQQCLAQVQDTQQAADRLLAHPAWAGVPLWSTLPEKQVAELGALTDAWSQAVRAPLRLSMLLQDGAYLSGVLERRVLRLNRDTLYEIWVLLRAVRVCREAGWSPVDFDPPANASGLEALFQREGAALRLFYQRIPEPMAAASEYVDLMTRHNLDHTVRRPDLVLEFTRENVVERRYLIVEVKRSKDRQYLADGAYKLMGYLHDFRGALESSGPTQGILVGWDGLHYAEEHAGQPIVLSSHANFSDALAAALTS